MSVPKKRFEKGVAFTVDFNGREDPEKSEQQLEMSKLTKSYYESYFKKINRQKPEDKTESP